MRQQVPDPPDDRPEMTIELACPTCHQPCKLTVRSEDVRQWKNGMNVQLAFPYLEPSQRELLISGVCSACCDSIDLEDRE